MKKYLLEEIKKLPDYEIQAEVPVCIFWSENGKSGELYLTLTSFLPERKVLCWLVGWFGFYISPTL